MKTVALIHDKDGNVLARAFDDVELANLYIEMKLTGDGFKAHQIRVLETEDDF